MADRLLRRAWAWAVCAVLMVAGPASLHAASSMPPIGLWSTEDHGGVVQIRPCGEALCGFIVGLSVWPADGRVVRDVHGRPQCHLKLLDDLRLNTDDHRWHGSVTNPEDGRTYDAEVWVADDGILRLRGYIGVPLLGSTQRWESFAGLVQPDCHFHDPTRG